MWLSEKLGKLTDSQAGIMSRRSRSELGKEEPQKGWAGIDPRATLCALRTRSRRDLFVKEKGR
jgi:hypothetical protein